MIPASAYVAPSAVLCGAVTLGERTRVLHGAVLTAEDGEIWIGDDVVIMENALVRGRSRHPVSVGNAVLIGPHVHLNGATVEDEVFIATGASLFPGSIASKGSELRSTACCMSTRLMPKRLFPSVGSQLAILLDSSHLTSMRLWRVQAELDFPGTVYGVPRNTPLQAIMAKQVEFYGAHRDDQVING